MAIERQYEWGTVPRRFAGSLFTLALFSQLFVPCWTSASLGRSTPSCCQAHGKHHCAVASARANSTDQDAKKGYALCSSPEKCPFRNVLVQHFFGKFALIHPRLLASEATEPSRLPVVLFGFATSGFSSHTSRGPPLPERQSLEKLRDINS
jgi:hypothetical protein